MSNIATLIEAGDALTFKEACVRSQYTGFWFIGLEKYKQKNLGRADVFWRRFDLFGGLQEYMFTNGVWRFDSKTDSVYIDIVKEEYFYNNKGEDDDVQELHNGHKSFVLTNASQTEIASPSQYADLEGLSEEEEDQINADRNKPHVKFSRVDPESNDKSGMATPPSEMIFVSGGVGNMQGVEFGQFNNAEELKQYYVANGFD